MNDSREVKRFRLDVVLYGLIFLGIFCYGMYTMRQRVDALERRVDELAKQIQPPKP